MKYNIEVYKEENWKMRIGKFPSIKNLKRNKFKIHTK